MLRHNGSHQDQMTDTPAPGPAPDDDAPPPREDLVSRWVDGELVVLDRAQGRLHHLNATASLVFAGLSETRSVQRIVDQLVAAYGVDPAVAQQDVSTIVGQFRALGLLAAPGAGGPGAA